MAYLLPIIDEYRASDARALGAALMAHTRSSAYNPDAWLTPAQARAVLALVAGYPATVDVYGRGAASALAVRIDGRYWRIDRFAKPRAVDKINLRPRDQRNRYVEARFWG